MHTKMNPNEAANKNQTNENNNNEATSTDRIKIYTSLLESTKD